MFVRVKLTILLLGEVVVEELRFNIVVKVMIPPTKSIDLTCLVNKLRAMQAYVRVK